MAALTGLGSQLRALVTNDGRGPRFRASLLFDTKEAADIDVQTIFALALTGLEELVKMDGKFSRFKKNLFSVQSSQTNRESENSEFNQKLNALIDSFLNLLSGYILLLPAHQIFEYLIRRYKIHVYNVDSIMLNILPYHETTIFVRIVKLLELDKTRWEFLGGVKKSGAAPPRAVLVERCTRDMALLDAVCEIPMKNSWKSRTAVTFSSVLIMETLAQIPSITTDIVNRLLPFILRSFNSKVSEEFLAGGMLIVATMVNRATLSKSLLSTMIDSVAKVLRAHAQDVSVVRLCFMVMIEITQTQELECFPPSASKNIVKFKEFTNILAELANHYSVDNFILLALKALVINCYEKELVRVIRELPLAKHVDFLICELSKFWLNYDKKQESSTTKESLIRILGAAEKRFPTEFASALSKLLEEFEKKKDASALESMNELLEKTLHVQIPESRMSLYVSIDHPEANVRKAAIVRMSEISGIDDIEAGSFIRNALLRRLGDDDLSVVLTVLSVAEIEKIMGVDHLVKGLRILISKCMANYETGTKLYKAEATKVLKSCFKLLGFIEWEQELTCAEELASFLFSYLLLKPKTRKLNVMVFKVASKLPVTLFKYLTDDLDEETEEDEAIWCSKMNEKISGAISASVLENSSSLDLILEAARKNDSAKLLTVLALLVGYQQDSSGSSKLFSEECFSFLRNEWVSISSDRADWESLKVDPTSELNFKEIYQRIGGTSAEVYAELIIRSLYMVVSHLVPSEKDERANNIFVLFAGSPSWQLFQSHIKLLLQRLTSDWLLFLSQFFLSKQPVHALVQVHSLQILASCFTEGFMPTTGEQLQLALPRVFVTLGSSLKGLRRGSVDCMKAMLEVSSSYKQPKNGKSLLVLPSELIEKLLQAVIACEGNFINDAGFLASFCSFTFQGDDSSDNRRFTAESSKAVVSFLLKNVMQLPVSAQKVVLEAFRSVGYVEEKASSTETELFQLLQKRRLYHLSSAVSPSQSLVEEEISLFEFLLEINTLNLSRILGKGKKEKGLTLRPLLEALDVEGGSLTDPAVVQPCVIAMKYLSKELYSMMDEDSQDLVFEALIYLTSVEDDNIRPAALKSTEVVEEHTSVICKHINLLFMSDMQPKSSKKKKRMKSDPEDSSRQWPDLRKTVSSSVALLEFLFRVTKKHARKEFLVPLFGLLQSVVQGQWPKSQVEIATKDLEYFKQMILMVLEHVVASVQTSEDEDLSSLDVELIVECVKSATDSVTRKHALAVLTVVSNICPDRVLKHLIDVVSVTMSEDGSHLLGIIQEILAAVVPSWLMAMNDVKQLLQIFVEALPRISLQCQHDLIRGVLRVTNEDKSLPSFLLLLIKQLQTNSEEWLLKFGEDLYRSYPLNARLPALVKLLDELQDELSDELHIVTKFVAKQLEMLPLPVVIEDDSILEDTWRSLMEHVLKQLQMLSEKSKGRSKLKKSCTEAAHLLLDAVTKVMTPSQFCKSVASLLRNINTKKIHKKVLQLYVSKLKETVEGSKTKKRDLRKKEQQFLMGLEPQAYEEIVLQIVELIKSTDDDDDDESTIATKLAAVAALDISAQRFGEASPAVFVSCLASLVERFNAADEVSMAIATVRCTASILSKTGRHALPNLPQVMNGLLKAGREYAEESLGESSDDLKLGFLLALEAILKELGTFLSPYIGDVISLVVLHPAYSATVSNAIVSSSVRSLIAEKIPARLILDPLIKSYDEGVESGEASTAALFEVLSVVCSKLDRPSVAAYHKRIFEFCLGALDIRRKKPETISAVDVVEDSVISAVVSLVMKLSEVTFKPLFVAVVEWTESTSLDGEAVEQQSIDRSITFHKLVNKLADKLRSVFVPYFGYLLDGCVARLTNKKEEEEEVKKKKKKKAKLTSSSSSSSTSSALSKWHLQHLVVASLHRCFLYDNIGFLDAPKFQRLLEPLTGQLVEEVPDADVAMSVPTVKEVDDTLIACVSQMALTAASDLLWKPLNHQVLMHTRRSSGRTKRLALEIVRKMGEQLREEYLVLLPETIPFLAELLEDEDLSIVSHTQQVLKMLEQLSGESLSQYL